MESGKSSSSSAWAAYDPKAMRATHRCELGRRQMGAIARHGVDGTGTTARPLSSNFDMSVGAQQTTAVGSSQKESRFTANSGRQRFESPGNNFQQREPDESSDVRLLALIPICASITLWIRRSHPGILDRLWHRLQNLGLLPWTVIGILFGSWAGRTLPKLLEYIQRLKTRRLSNTRKFQQYQTLQDPSEKGGKGAGKESRAGGKGHLATPTLLGGKGSGGKGNGANTAISKTPDTRDEYLRNHIEHRLRKRVAASLLTDNQIYNLGKQRFGDQEAYFLKLESGEIIVPENGSVVFRPPWAIDTRDFNDPGGRNYGRDPREEKPLSEKLRNPNGDIKQSKSWWPEDEYDDPPFWWRKRKDVVFDLPITAEEDLTSLAPKVYQWWDPEKVSESDNFVAVSKPAGMFVVTDEKGLWEVSPTNFIHVSHQRFDIGSATEPNQRGICHRLDSHTSGVQIFGRSWEAFRHFTKENSSHRVQKEYLALVDGRLSENGMPGTGIIDVPMIKWKDFDRREFGSIVCGGEGLPAVTMYKALRQWKVPAKGKMEFLKEDRWFTLVQLRIMSGRTHQIRVHMAIIGHPLVGDIKYNHRHFESDSAIVPRIFLHCLKMEFKEFDDSLFVASSELAPDLQAVLKYIDYLSKTESGTIPLTDEESKDPDEKADDIPGLGRILADSQYAKVQFPPAPEGTAEKFQSRSIVHRCLKCMSREDMNCTMIQRKGKLAMSWSLRISGVGEIGENLKRAPTSDQQIAAGQRCWGPGMLWVPTLLQLQERSIDVDLELEAAKVVEVAEDCDSRWKSFGVDWCWAHNGTTPNGWFRLCNDGILDSKWGPGVWEFFGPPSSSSSSLLLVTFNGTQHALRLMEGDEGRFEVMSRRKTRDGEKSLREDPEAASSAFDPSTPAICATRGWPKSEA